MPSRYLGGDFGKRSRVQGRNLSRSVIIRTSFTSEAAGPVGTWKSSFNAHPHLQQFLRDLDKDRGEPFDEKMPRLVAELHAQFAESAKLEQAIKVNLRGLGYGR